MRLRRLEPVIRRSVRGPCWVPRGSRVLVAVSGGADSTALLLAFQNLSHELGIELHAAHLHHGLRGKQADGDLDFVRQLCARVGVPFTGQRWNTRLRMRRRRLSGQAGLRTLRREFLLAVARRSGAAAIATAHTADDQLETLLLRLMRGSGLVGFGAMQPRRGIWIKPMLDCTRADLEADLLRVGQSWREDETNTDLRYARNRVRHRVVPAMIEAMGGDPRLSRSTGARLARHAQIVATEAADAQRALEWIVEFSLSGAQRIQATAVQLETSALRNYPIAIQRTALREIWKRIGGRADGLRRAQMVDLVKMLKSLSLRARIELPGGRLAVHDQGSLWMGEVSQERQTRRLRLEIPGRVRFGAERVSIRWLPGDRAIEQIAQKPAGDEFFAAEELEGRLELRTAKADERFVPFGRRQPVRLGSFLSRQRVSIEEKLRPTVLADARGILWVIGVRRSARAPITKATRRALWVHTEHP